MSAKSTDPSTHQSFWLWVMCLSGVDYFSTLGYQPSTAYESAGELAPLATVILVLVTLGCALPVYCYVAARSPYGQGSIYMLEQLVKGWTGKVIVLLLLGFAATDFVITKTLSAADATEHLISNSLWPVSATMVSRETQLIAVTMFLLMLLGAVFMRGFSEVIGVAVVIVGVYLVLNALVIGSGLYYLSTHSELLGSWWNNEVLRGPEHWHIKETPPLHGTGFLTVLLVSLLLFPKLALGLSGFETGVAVMPLVRPGSKHDEHDTPTDPLQGRIRNTRKLLITAAVIMSVYLLGSSIVVTTLIEPECLHGLTEVTAKERALAYLAHGESPMVLNPLFGSGFGTVYDISTIAILWFAGASAMAGLLNLVPLYLPRYGMAPAWARSLPPLVLMFTAINLIVTWIFRAKVDAQSDAYATGVLMLMSSACFAAVVGTWKDRTGPWYRRLSWYYLATCIVFVYTTVTTVLAKPVGMKISGWFIGVLLVSSIITRILRSTEWRFERFHFADDASRAHWDEIRKLGFHILVPHRPGQRSLAHKDASIRLEHRLGADLPLVFIQVSLGDASDFFLEPVMTVHKVEDYYLVQISHVSSTAHALAAVGLELTKNNDILPPEYHFDWSEESSIKAILGFLLFGEGNVPSLVRDILKKVEPNPERRPRVVVG